MNVTLSVKRARLWVGADWAWGLTIILSGLGIIGGIIISYLPAGITMIIINVPIAYYFTRSNIKKFFGN